MFTASTDDSRKAALSNRSMSAQKAPKRVVAVILDGRSSGEYSGSTSQRLKSTGLCRSADATMAAMKLPWSEEELG